MTLSEIQAAHPKCKSCEYSDRMKKRFNHIYCNMDDKPYHREHYCPSHSDFVKSTPQTEEKK